MPSFLIYNMSGELDDMSHLFPSERLARIAAVLSAQGHEAIIRDTANFQDLMGFGADKLENLGNLAYADSNELHSALVDQEAEQVLATDCDVVFLNLFHGTGFKFTMDLARKLKNANPNVKLYGVGQKVDWFTENILALPDNALDGLVTGLGYNAIEKLGRGTPIQQCPNAIYPGPDGPVVTDKVVLDLEDYPDPAYGAQVYRNLAYKVPVYPVTLSNLACPNYCRFCLRPDNYGRQNIARDVQHTFSEILHLYREAGIRHFRVEDSTPPAGTLTQLARAILDSPLAGKIKLSAFSRVDTNRNEDFGLLKEAGIVSLFFGVEALDDDMLLALGKGFDSALAGETLRKAHHAGIKTVGSFIFPIPGQTAAQREGNLEGIRRVADVLDSLIALPAGIYPPTEWGRNPEKFGIVLEEDYMAKCVIYPIKSIQPLRFWPPPPFSYELFGTPGEEVQFNDIVETYEQFVQIVRQEMQIPGLPDYYFLLGEMLDQDAPAVTAKIVEGMVKRDYDAIYQLFKPVMPS